MNALITAIVLWCFGFLNPCIRLYEAQVSDDAPSVGRWTSFLVCSQFCLLIVLYLPFPMKLELLVSFLAILSISDAAVSHRIVQSRIVPCVAWWSQCTQRLRSGEEDEKMEDDAEKID